MASRRARGGNNALTDVNNNYAAVGFFMAGYTIIYGQLQVFTQGWYSPKRCFKRLPNRKDVPNWAFITAVEVCLLGGAHYSTYQTFLSTNDPTPVVVVLIIGIILFAVFFAFNSAVHSFLIVKYSRNDKVSMDVGFYYMANAGGRLTGILTSGFIYTYTVTNFGLSVCLWVSSGMLIVTGTISLLLGEEDAQIVVMESARPGGVSATRSSSASAVKGAEEGDAGLSRDGGISSSWPNRNEGIDSRLEAQKESGNNNDARVVAVV